MTKHDYPNLGLLLGAYFSQDWEELYVWEGKEPNFEDVVKLYTAEASEKKISQTIDELEHLINRKLGEEDLDLVVYRQLHSFLRPPGLGMTYLEWLEAILAILKEGKVENYLKRIY